MWLIKFTALVVSLFVSNLSLAQVLPDAENNPKAWIYAMQKAQKSTDFSGFFIYERGVASHSFAFSQSVDTVDGLPLPKQHLRFLDGAEHAVYFDGEKLLCLHDELKSYHAVSSMNVPSLLAQMDFGEEVWRFYEPRLLADSRIADRQVKQIQLLPKDGHRFSYVFGIDKETGLMLKMMLVESRASGDNQPAQTRVLERLRYVSIDASSSASQVKHRQPDLSAFKEHNPHTRSNFNASPAAPVFDVKPKLLIGWLPAGFAMKPSNDLLHSDRAHIDNNRELYRAHFTDGLSSFSLFLEPADNQSSSRSTSMRQGSTAMVVRGLNYRGQRLDAIVMGEVPLKSLQLIAGSLSLSD